MEEYRALFLAEARDYLQGMTDHLLHMEKDPGDAAHLTEVFRSAHSLKGMAGTMGYNLISGLTHKMETLLDSLRGGHTKVETEMVSLLFEAVDLVQLMVNNLDRQADYTETVLELEHKLLAWLDREPGLEPVPVKQNINQLAVKDPDKGTSGGGSQTFNKDVQNFNEYEKEMLKDAMLKGKSILHIHVRLLEGSLLKAVRAYMIYKAVEDQGDIIKTEPCMPELEEGQFERDFSLFVVGLPDHDELRRSIEGISEVEKVHVVPLVPDWEPEMEIAATAAVFVSPEGDTPAISTADLPLEQEYQPPSTSDMANRLAIPRDNKEKAPTLARAAEKTVRVETAKLDILVNLVGELVINRTRVLELGKGADKELLEGSLEQLKRITNDLQSAVMTLRMFPIKQVFHRFPRMVRDLAIGQNKEVELVITGEDTELDRTIVNQVGDPLVHLLRNAVDHGIETPEERKAKGKNPAGRIVLEAHHEGSHVVVSVSDDGKGIDPEAIKKKVLEKGIVSSQELEIMNGSELVNLIFRSGFSTSETVTDISGRGVGMDVVKTSVEAINGTVELKSEIDKGSHFVLRLPLTLAIIHALMVKAGNEIYAIPIEAILENIFVEPDEIRTVNRDRVITLREEVLPLSSLSESLGMGTFKQRKMYPVVVVRAGNKKAGLIVDDLLGQQEIVIKSLSKFVDGIRGIAGATVLGDGRVALILDVATLLEDGRVIIGKESSHH